MSGVLYGLFGYIWLRSQCDPNSGLGLSSATVAMMIVWFFLCLFGVIGNVANGTHVVGFILGMAWGAAPMTKRFLGG
jgi:GlpG protein